MSALSAAAHNEDGDEIQALRARVADLEGQLIAKFLAACQDDAENPTNIDSPMNACMYQAACKRWRDQAKQKDGARQPLTAERIEELIEEGVFRCNPHELVRRIEEERGTFKTRPLTDEQIAKIVENYRLNVGDWTRNGTSVARAIERAHGITGAT